jgi:phage/plasmid-like protein (TIGR03299 family)
MSHELEIVNGQASMAYAGTVPWHGLGVSVPENTSAMDMMALAGLDWRVEELDSFVEVNGEKIPTGMKALVRDVDNKVLTQVGPNWNPVQNSEAFEFFHDFVEAGDMKMHTAGSLKDGTIIWALAKVEDQFELFNGDKVESYLLFSNPHQYGKTIDIRFTPIRVVCNNTLTLSLGKSAQNSVKLNHRKAFDSASVKSTLGIAHSKLDSYREMAEHLGSKRYTATTLDEYLTELFGVKTGTKGDLTRTGETVRDLMETQPGAKYAEGSWWTAYNAVTYFADHVAGRSNDTRMQSAWFGVNQKKKVDALEKALEYADA